MKIVSKAVSLAMVTLIIFISISTTNINTYACLNLSSNNRNVVNAAVIFFRMDDPFTMKTAESLENIAKDNKNNIKFTFFDPKNNIAVQNEMLDSVVKSNYDLIILYLSNNKQDVVADVINRVKTKNKPLILMNIPTDVISNVYNLYNKIAFVTPDSKKAGVAEGKIIADLWNSNKMDIDKNRDNVLQYVLLQGPTNDPQVVDRSKYAISTINDSGIKTEQLIAINAGWYKDLAKDSIESLFLKYSDQIEAIISNNDAMAIGAIEALQKYGYNTGDKSRNIAVVGIDGLQEAIDLIDKGSMSGTVIQDSNVLAEVLYNVGMNLYNNLNPIENTNYQIENREIIIPYPYDVYTGKLNNQ
ncbi:galactose ABC transporter substrate-binding protein [Clostridium gelidum]|uniref:D-galactose/methyl-galactoside binding periplasmic protein MglB n=1 Tax=Clostridium gelidum TaxID=704125 RepID=A0ABM7T4S2_9CLOT|nr:galactose ABC transporter substrate-binding protein [Clostridium gelidum]BCZ45931.1 galactose ABC transporter substrate-binding protein [Clostridium gelidum]